MKIKEFHSLEEIQKYYDKESNTYVFKEDDEYIDLAIFNFDLTVEANIEALTIKARNIDVKIFDIVARDMYTMNINAGDIYARDIKAKNIDAKNIKKARDINAEDINSLNINALDINAFNIDCVDIIAKNVHEEELNIIEKDLDRLEKLEKVIEILKKALLLNVKEIRGLYYVLGYDTNYCMTKEEFELVKGVLENDK